MKIKVLYIERKFNEFFSLEKVFRQIAKSLSQKIFEISFQQVKYISNSVGILKNLVSFKPLKADIYHITGHITFISLILPSKNTVLTIPDLGILQFRKGLRRLILKKLLFDLPIRKSKYITAISQTTKDDIVQNIACDANKIRVIEIPLDENFTTEEKAEFNAECPRILQIGTAPHKNLPNVIKAIEGLKCQLIIIGRLDENTISLLKKKNIQYQNEFEIDEDQIKQHYQLADLVVFCSLFEGFGLPIIEAQAMKTPVITSNINPMEEVAGNGALLVNPHNYQEIRQAIEKLTNDKVLRENLVSNGIENTKRFHHQFIADKYAELYLEIFEKNQI